MIEISFGKLVLLALIALIVLGPEKLPGVARTAGALLRRMRSGWDDVRAEVERELQIEEIKRNAREVAARAEAAQTELDATLQQVRDMRNAAPARDEAVAGEVAPATEATAADEPDNATGDLFAGMGGPATTAPKEPPHGHA
ncbi:MULTISPECIES: Sec-independent protein translocase protein TatB [unclassified Rhodanobacter]|uniref:Sec-independent protein translocase protein TatB n=1 Tax=unclassified Rhodanobacter TaxID=2621553 RepID=UPI001BDE39C8|nr:MULTISPECIES: Sec-independent protein translocase protein TatB [unclassified Rhodanobacter]MBT2143725.1 Sec-independent protein translocase protein TatB [Rhodanobacter sp. LX-99]MBT2147201.1 Sec-independent protein translocase protein TatB [Rhodanobacter sp. LX-100]